VFNSLSKQHPVTKPEATFDSAEWATPLTTHPGDILLTDNFLHIFFLAKYIYKLHNGYDIIL